MTQVTAEMVKQLRDRTGVGMAKCKEALVNANGDMEEAIHILRKAGMASAVKKGGRETNEGAVGVGESDAGIVLVEFNVETDFVLQNDRFKEFLQNICKEAVEAKAKSAEELAGMKSSADPSKTIEEYRAELVLSLGENIVIKRLEYIPKEKDFSYGVYSHMGGKIVTFVEIKGDNQHETLARNIAMHAAAESPEYLKPEEVPAEIIAKEEEIARAQIKGKPENIIGKIVEGKLKAYYEQACLLNQKYVRDPSMTIAQLVEKSNPALQVTRFLRWQIGAE